MLKYLNEQEKQESRNLWEEAFPEDSKSFDDYYYKDKVKGNRILAIKEDGRIQSMIQLNPYLLCVDEKRWRIDYLVGVATRKDKRHQGYMRRLLKKMMEDMHQEQMPFCFLMPADEAIYRPFGFTYIYDQPQWGLKDSTTVEKKVFSCQSASQQKVVSDWMNRWMAARYRVYALRDLPYVADLSKQIKSEAGTLMALYNKKRLVGFESWWGTPKPEQRLLYCEEEYREETALPKPAIMARIITPESFIRVIHLKSKVKAEEISIVLQLEDPLIEENQGLWIWRVNHQTSWLERADEMPQSAKDEKLAISVEKLTGWLFGYEMPQEAESYREIIETLSDIFLDEVV